MAILAIKTYFCINSSILLATTCIISDNPTRGTYDIILRFDYKRERKRKFTGFLHFCDYFVFWYYFCLQILQLFIQWFCNIKMFKKNQKHCPFLNDDKDVKSWWRKLDNNRLESTCISCFRVFVFVFSPS